MHEYPGYLRKPIVGDLVQIDLSNVAEKLDLGKGFFEEGDLWPSEFQHMTGGAGIVIKCTGIRCKVLWSDGKTTTPERAALRIL